MLALQDHSPKHRRTETFSAETRLGRQEARYAKQHAIDVVASLGGGLGKIASFPDAAAALAGTAGVFVEPRRIFNGGGRHLPSLERYIALFVHQE